MRRCLSVSFAHLMLALSGITYLTQLIEACPRSAQLNLAGTPPMHSLAHIVSVHSLAQINYTNLCKRTYHVRSSQIPSYHAHSPRIAYRILADHALSQHTTSQPNIAERDFSFLYCALPLTTLLSLLHHVHACLMHASAR